MLILASFDMDNDVTASTPEGATATTMRELQGGGVDSFVRIPGIVIIAIHERSCHFTLTNVPTTVPMPGRMDTSYKVQQRATWYTLQCFINTHAHHYLTLCFTKQPLSTVSRIYYIKIVANVYCVFCVIRWIERTIIHSKKKTIYPAKINSINTLLHMTMLTCSNTN